MMMMMVIPTTRTKSIRGSEEDDASDEDQVDEGLVQCEEDDAPRRRERPVGDDDFKTTDDVSGPEKNGIRATKPGPSHLY